MQKGPLTVFSINFFSHISTFQSPIARCSAAQNNLKLPEGKNFKCCSAKPWDMMYPLTNLDLATLGNGICLRVFSGPTLVDGTFAFAMVYDGWRKACKSFSAVVIAQSVSAEHAIVFSIPKSNGLTETQQGGALTLSSGKRRLTSHDSIFATGTFDKCKIQMASKNLYVKNLGVHDCRCA